MLQIIAGIAATHYSNDKNPSHNNPSLSNSNSSTPSEAASLVLTTNNSSSSNEVSSSNNKLSPSSQNVIELVDSAVCTSTTSSITPVSDRPSYDINKLTVDPDCTECRITRRHPSPGQLVMFLHAVSYQVKPVI